MIPNVKSRIDCSMDAAFLEAKIGGASKELKETIYKIRCVQAFPIQRFITPKEGILLCGPPGTGKTYIARRIPMLLGIKPKNVEYCCADTKIDKLFHESESNEWKALIVTDVADIYRNLSELMKDKRENLSKLIRLEHTINKLVKLLKTVHLYHSKIIIICSVDSPKDQQYFFLQGIGYIFENRIPVKLPEQLGRKEIFEIQAKGLQNNGLLCPDVNFNLLAEKTEGLSAQKIQNIVHRSTRYSLDRLFQNKVTAEDAKDHPDAKITQADFEQALVEEMKQNQQVKTVPLNLFL